MIEIYKEINTIKEEENKRITLVQSEIDHLFYIKREIPINNIYQQLHDHHVQGTPRIIEIEKHEKTMIIIEEYCNDETLQQYLENHTLTNEQRQTIIQQLCTIVNSLHQCIPPIIHRDIKPSNIFISVNTIKLFDFDISRQYNDEKNTDTHILGSIGYAAPEQFGLTQSDEKVDIYAIGVLINELYTGALPSQLLAPKPIDFIVVKATHINPKERYKSVEELYNDYQRRVLKVKGLRVKDDRPFLEKYMIPGFRSKTPWKMVTASISYIFLIAVCAVTEFEEIPKGSVEEIFNKCIVFFGLVVSIFFFCNYCGIKDKSLFQDHKNILVRGIGLFVTWMGLLFCVMLFAFIISGML